MILDDIINQIESCHYTCKAGNLESNIAWKELKRFARNLEKQNVTYAQGLPEVHLDTSDVSPSPGVAKGTTDE